MNSRAKGCRGEREWRDELRAAGFLKSRRGQQFSGGCDSPDVICEDLPSIHWEVKRTQKLNIYDAMLQAERDCGRATSCACASQIPVVAHKRNHGEWLCILPAKDFLNILRRSDLPVSSSKMQSVASLNPKTLALPASSPD